MTIGEKYRPAMGIMDEGEAAEYFEACVEHTMRFGRSRAEAEKIERENLNYFAGYCDRDTQRRVESLFGGCHPIFGPVGGVLEPKTPDEAFAMGVRAGLDTR
jgi:hypothetical protein